jgi:hypothetical protein
VVNTSLTKQLKANKIDCLLKGKQFCTMIEGMSLKLSLFSVQLRRMPLLR